MKSSKVTTYLTSFMMLFVLLFVLYLSTCKPWHKIEKGQIWVKEYNVDNPFEKPIRDTLYILDIKNGYVKYKTNGKIYSCEKYWIPINAHLLNKKCGERGI